MKVAIWGSGIAASGCAQLLARQNIETMMIPVPRAPAPVVLLSDPARALLCDVFADQTIFAHCPRVTRRIVAWGDGDPVALPHEGAILLPDDLDTLRPPVTALPGDPDGSEAMTVHTAAPFPSGDARRFGTRMASAVAVALRFPDDATVCWIEAVEGGWLFLIPLDAQQAWLLCVGDGPQALLDQSRHISARVGDMHGASAQFDVSPRLLTTLQGRGWLACGTAAIAFDPICGDGTAQALREAILASAIVAATRDGGDAQALRCHHESMFIAAMRRHLKLCFDFYQRGGKGPWWQAQLADIAEGFDWCTARLATLPEPRYHLRGFNLIEREAVT